jgi:hypothetical protein
MRLIQPAVQRHERRWAVAVSLGMLLVGFAAVLVMGLLPGDRLSAVAALGISAALGLGVGLAWLIRAVSDVRRPMGDDLARLLGGAFDDAYVLILSPRLPGVPVDLAALLVGPPGVRAIVARRWRGRYRVRGRGWEYDTRSSSGWIPCRTNPTFEAAAVADAVTRWVQGATDDPATHATPAVAFPRSSSVIVLEEPDGEIVTTDNAPWYAQRIGRVQRMDAARVARFVQAVMDGTDAAMGARRAPVAATQQVP